MIHCHVALPLCCQGEQILKDGIGTAAEVEEDVEPVAARAYLTDPSGLLAASPLVKTLGE